MTDEITDYLYAFQRAEKPVGELSVGAPAVYDRDRAGTVHNQRTASTRCMNLTREEHRI